MKNISKQLWGLVPQEIRPSTYYVESMAIDKFFHGNDRRKIRFIANIPGRCISKVPEDDIRYIMKKNKTYRIGI